MTYIKKGTWGQHPNSLRALRVRTFFNQIDAHGRKLRVLQAGLLNAGFRRPSLLLVCAIYALDKAAQRLKNNTGS